MTLNNIRQIRTEKGMTATELAELAGLSIGYISHLESGSRKNPSYATMKKIAKALNREVFEVFK